MADDGHGKKRENLRKNIGGKYFEIYEGNNYIFLGDNNRADFPYIGLIIIFKNL